MKWILSSTLNIITIIMNKFTHLRTLYNKQLKRTVYSASRKGQNISIVEQGSVRSLYFDGKALQSRVDLHAPHKFQLQYPRYMTGSLLFNHEPKRILILGIGGGSLISFFHHHFPQCIIESVDNDAAITQLAIKYFSAPEHANISYHHDDGLNFLQNLPQIPRYDLIFVDGFNAQGMSAALYNQHCFQLCRKLLFEDGTLVSNLWSSNQVYFKRVRHELQCCFPANMFIPVPRRGNHICYSRKQNDSWKKIEKSKKELNELSAAFEIDFGLIVSLARRHNLNFLDRIIHRIRSSTPGL